MVATKAASSEGTAVLMKDSRLTIVGGCGSSGTTLLTHLLSRHPQVASGPEFNCFNHHELFDFNLLRTNYRKMFSGKCQPSGYIDVYVFMTFRDYYGISIDVIEDWFGSSASTSDFVGRLTDHLSRRFDSDCLVEKSPTNVYSFQKLADAFPRMPLIHLIRDGRDVVCSLMKRGFNLFGAGSRWLYDTLAGLACRECENYLELRYEDLARDPGATLEKAFNHIGLEWDPVWLEKWDNASPGVYVEDWKERKEPQVWKQTPSDPISTSSVGRYRKQLSRSDLDLLNRIELTKYGAGQLGATPTTFHDLLDLLGYNSNDDTGSDITGLSQRAGYLFAELQDYIRRHKRFSHSHVQWLPHRYTRIGRRSL